MRTKVLLESNIYLSSVKFLGDSSIFFGVSLRDKCFVSLSLCIGLKHF